jgi:hypothetical protein
MLDPNHLHDEFEKLHHFVMIDGGKGSPSLSTRVTLMEETVANISSNLGKMVWLLVAIFFGIMADLVVHATKWQI